MVQSLQFGLPNREGLLCDVHGCKELADWLVRFGGEEQFACNAHRETLYKKLEVPGSRLQKLNIPGDHNRADGDG